MLAGNQGVTAEMEVRLEALWGGSDEMSLVIQQDHDLWRAKPRIDARSSGGCARQRDNGGRSLPFGQSC